MLAVKYVFKNTNYKWVVVILMRCAWKYLIHDERFKKVFSLHYRGTCTGSAGMFCT